jgi:dolichol kinase
LFRKILHFILLGVYIPLVFAFDAWWMASVLALGMIVLFFPLLALAERIPHFSAFVNERKGGEFKNSMVLAIGMMAFSIAVCWGWLGDRYLVLACIYAWGVGDAFAALIGKRFGKHKIRWKYADAHKSVEGSAAMFLCAFLSVMIVLLIRGGLPVGAILLMSAAAAVACTVAELCAKGGMDTVICPLCAMAVILPLNMICGG